MYIKNWLGPGLECEDKIRIVQESGPRNDNSQIQWLKFSGICGACFLARFPDVELAEINRRKITAQREGVLLTGCMIVVGGQRW